MSFRLPSTDHPARALMGDLAHVAQILDPANLAKMLTTMEARKAAERAFAEDTTGAIRRVNFIILRADTGERWLISFGKRGGWRKEWNFGDGRPVEDDAEAQYDGDYYDSHWPRAS